MKTVPTIGRSLTCLAVLAFALSPILAGCDQHTDANKTTTTKTTQTPEGTKRTTETTEKKTTTQEKP